jgi:hypothetical protein
VGFVFTSGLIHTYIQCVFSFYAILITVSPALYVSEPLHVSPSADTAASSASSDLVKPLLPAEVQGPAPAATALHPMLYLFSLLGTA